MIKRIMIEPIMLRFRTVSNRPSIFPSFSFLVLFDNPDKFVCFTVR